MAEAITFQSLQRDMRAGKTAPVYLLHGEEGYFIDELVKEFEALVPEADRDFDLTILYAPELDSPKAVLSECRQCSMFSTRRVVILKEAQNCGANFLNALSEYVAAPSPSTTLCICCRGQKATGAEFMKALKAGGGIIFESTKIRDYQMGPFVKQFISDKGLTSDPKALNMLIDFVGADLSRVYNEIDKLTVTLGKGAMITPEAVERNIGISKDYNNFEFISALANRDEVKTMKIYNVYKGNPKAHVPQSISPIIFNYFANLLTAIYTPDKSQRAMMDALGLKTPYQLKDYQTGMRNYSAWEVIEIISLIRQFDCNSKGIESRQDAYDLFFDLLQHILHPLGQRGVRI